MTPVKLPIDPFLKPNLTTKLLGVGLVLTIIFILIALFSPLLQAIGLIQDPTDILSNYPLQPPSSAHWFGTNVRVYDVFSRTLFGARAALSVVFWPQDYL
jgi:peptide/nickel transport system permease protein